MDAKSLFFRFALTPKTVIAPKKIIGSSTFSVESAEGMIKGEG